MGRVKFSGFLTGVGGEIAHKVFVDVAQHVVALPSVCGDNIQQGQEVADIAGLLGGVLPEVAEAAFQRVEYAAEDFLMGFADEAAEGGERRLHVADGKVRPFPYPRGEKIFIRDEVAKIGLEVLHEVVVFFVERASDDIIGHLQFPEEGLFLIGEEFVEDEAEHIVLVLAGLDARTSHLVRRVPQFLRKLLLFHDVSPVS